MNTDRKTNSLIRSVNYHLAYNTAHSNGHSMQQ